MTSTLVLPFLRGLDVVLGLAILFVPGELAVELLAELLDVGGGVFEAAEPLRIYGATEAHLGLIATPVSPNSLNAGRAIARSRSVLPILRYRALPQIVSAVVQRVAINVVATWVRPAVVM